MVTDQVFPANTKRATVSSIYREVWKATMFASSSIMPELLKPEAALKAPTHLEVISISGLDMTIDGAHHGFNPLPSVSSRPLFATQAPIPMAAKICHEKQYNGTTMNKISSARYSTPPSR